MVSAAEDIPVAPLNDEVLGLIVFRSALSDPSGALSSWSEADATPCGWQRVECDPATSRVVRLELPSLSLQSSRGLPRGLDRLPSLRSLVLSRNNLSGPLPSGLSLLPSLRSLDLSSNSLSGPSLRPPLLPCLRFLDLSSNSFSGPSPPLSLLPPLPPPLPQLPLRPPPPLALLLNAPSSPPQPLQQPPHRPPATPSPAPLPDSLRLLSSLVSFSAAGNRLSGPLPAWVGNLSVLQLLDFADNDLSGSLPDTFGGLRDLNYLGLSNNRLGGSIPRSLAQCARLRELRMKGNALSGSIPEALFDLGLESIDLSSNQLSGAVPAGSARLAEALRWLDLSENRFAGNIPAEMGLFFNVRYLNLSWNELRTQLPPELGLFRNLSVLDLRSSALYGPIPGELCDSGSLAVLQLDGNALSGAIPPEIANCSSLYLLSLSHNSLSGSIPAAMAELKKLEILRLEYNNLTGEIPPQLAGLDNLLAVNISHNRLIGRLPAGPVFETLDSSAIDGNLGICSPLVAEPCRMNVPKPLVLDPNAYPHDGGRSGGAANQLVDFPGRATAKRRNFLSVSAIVAISAAVVILVGVAVVTLLNISARRRIGLLENALESICSSSTKSTGSPAVGKTVLFGQKSSLRSEVETVGGAEALLSKAAELGRGVFGTVYKASVGEGRAVAIKKLLAANVVNSHDDFDREVRTLGKARHRNLMPVKGYYWTPQLQLLISDYAPRGSLHARLHEVDAALFSWPDRLKVVLGVAKGLAYLHQSFRPPIIHYNIKPSNVLLDESGEPMVSDFGLARLLPKLDRHVASARFQGGMGYVAPELACQSLRINEKCDVYGFGILVLEVVTGRRPVEYGEDDVVILIDRVRVALEQGNALGCVVDQRMDNAFPEEEVLPVLKLGLVCASQIPSSRPSMAEVVQILQVIKTPVGDRMGGF
ncbi:hypothetical protein ACMD2_17457 [Ananas comosus]|uniref:Protein kinase domain-containing protein n=1 Tax=Ananas comosus TaxID=4615 RepID=A0A199VHK1_ANACO|nr:hypothetical protein ACMD2_17457 [Ananas comosus]